MWNPSKLSFLPLLLNSLPPTENWLDLSLLKAMINRRSHRKFSMKKAVLKNFAIFPKKHLYWSLFFMKWLIKIIDFIKKGLQHRCFPVNISNFLRSCSYGSELARLAGLAHLGEISIFSRNSCKNIMCSYERSEPGRLGGISLDFAGIPPRWDKNFRFEHLPVDQSGKVG